MSGSKAASSCSFIRREGTRSKLRMWLAGLFKCQALSLPGPGNSCLPFWGSTSCLVCSVCNACCLCGHGNISLRVMCLRRFHPFYKAKCSSGCSLPWQPHSVFYSCKETVMLLRQPNLLTAFVFDTAEARKEKHTAVISLMRVGRFIFKTRIFIARHSQ